MKDKLGLLLTLSTMGISALMLPSLALAEQVRKVEDISIIGNRELPKSLIIVPWKGANMSDEPNLPEKSLVDKRFQLVSRSQLLREIQFHKLQK
jgi:hypothetical protein